MSSFFKKLLKRSQVPFPGGKGNENKTGFKLGGALALGPVLGPINPLSLDKDVLGARGSTKTFGLSVDREKEYKIDTANETAADANRDAARATEEQAQVAAKRVQEGQLANRRRNKRFAYGYDRSGAAGLLGGSGADGAPKTLLGY